MDQENTIANKLIGHINDGRYTDRGAIDEILKATDPNDFSYNILTKSLKAVLTPIPSLPNGASDEEKQIHKERLITKATIFHALFSYALKNDHLKKELTEGENITNLFCEAAEFRNLGIVTTFLTSCKNDNALRVALSNSERFPHGLSLAMTNEYFFSGRLVARIFELVKGLAEWENALSSVNCFKDAISSSDPDHRIQTAIALLDNAHQNPRVRDLIIETGSLRAISELGPETSLLRQKIRFCVSQDERWRNATFSPSTP